MNNNKAIGESLISKRFLGKWMGATYFAIGVAVVTSVGAISFVLEWLLRDLDINPNIWNGMLMLAVVAFLFFNVLGTVISLAHLLGGKNRNERFAGAICLLLNILPIIGGLISSF